MTYTATLQIGYYPGSARELFIEDAPVTVEFGADVRIERDPVEVDWPPVTERGVSVDCDAGSVEIESAWLAVPCLASHVDEDGRAILCGCNGSGVMGINILPTLSPTDLTCLREECAEWAREHAVEQGQTNGSKEK